MDECGKERWQSCNASKQASTRSRPACYMCGLRSCSLLHIHFRSPTIEQIYYGFTGHDSDCGLACTNHAIAMISGLRHCQLDGAIPANNAAVLVIALSCLAQPPTFLRSAQQLRPAGCDLLAVVPMGSNMLSANHARDAQHRKHSRALRAVKIRT